MTAPRKQGPPYLLILLVCALTVTATVAVVATHYHTPPIYIDDGGIAFGLLNGQGFTLAFHGAPAPTAAYTPIMPFLLAGLHALFGDGDASVVAVLVYQCLTHLTTALLTFALARIWLPPWLAAVAGSLVGIHYRLIEYATTAWHRDQRYSTSLVLILLSLWVFLRTWNHPRPSYRDLVFVGCAFGLAALSEATVLPFIAVAIAGIALWPPWHMPRRHAALVCLAALLATVSPWLIRNALVFRTFVPIRSSAGLLTWVGNNALATGLWEDQELMDDPGRSPVSRGSILLGGHAADFNFKSRETLPPDVLARLATEDEVQRDRLLGRVALRWIWNHPRRFLELTWMRAHYLAGDLEGSRSVCRLMKYSLAIALLIALACRLSGLRRIGMFLLAWWAIFSVTHCGYPDYRLMLEPLVALSLTCGVYRAGVRLAPLGHAALHLQVIRPRAGGR